MNNFAIAINYLKLYQIYGLQYVSINAWKSAILLTDYCLPIYRIVYLLLHKQPSRVVVRKRYSENMQQIYKRAPMPKCDFLLCNFIEITLRDGCYLVNLVHIFRTPFPKYTSGQLFLLLFF